MNSLNVTLIDVGWGDSIFIESEDLQSNFYYGLIDSNDTKYEQSSYLFLKRYFERKNIDFKNKKHLFDFVILSHAHSDHAKGLKNIISKFGTKNFFYPKSDHWTSITDLIKYGNKSTLVLHHQSIDNSKILPPLGNVTIKVLWPIYNKIEKNPDYENNNSVVLALTLNNITVLLTGDAEEKVWNKISNQIPNNTRFFKVPHHGSENGTFDTLGNTPWLNRCNQNTKLGISCHNTPHKFPDLRVINHFNSNNFEYFRTDKHYHITFTTDGTSSNIKYFH